MHARMDRSVWSVEGKRSEEKRREGMLLSGLDRKQRERVRVRVHRVT